MATRVGITVVAVTTAAALACGSDGEGTSSPFDSGSATTTATTGMTATDTSTSAPSGSATTVDTTAADSTEATGGIKLDVGSPGTTGNVTEGNDGCTFVDLLFVIDNSPSMGPYQEALAAAFPGFVDAMVSNLPSGTDLHVGITTTDFNCGSGGCSCSEATLNCHSTASMQAILDHYDTPDGGNNGGNGSQGRLYQYMGMNYFATTTDQDPAALKAWFTGAAVAAGETGCSFEMSSAGAGYAAHPANAADNAGFFRDEGAVLMIFILTDEPDKSPEGTAAYHDMITAVKAGCGGDECVLTAGLIDSCVQANDDPVWQFLSSFGEAPTWGDIDDTTQYTDVVGDALAGIVGETCMMIPPAG